MKISLPKDVLGKLPSPDSQGVVRVTAGLQINPESGEASIVEINDEPMPMEEEEEATDDDNPMPAESLPDLSGLPQGA